MVDFTATSTTDPEDDTYTLADADYCLVEAIKNLTTELKIMNNKK